jgi:hypothetical protein
MSSDKKRKFSVTVSQVTVKHDKGRLSKGQLSCRLCLNVFNTKISSTSCRKYSGYLYDSANSPEVERDSALFRWFHSTKIDGDPKRQKSWDMNQRPLNEDWDRVLEYLQTRDESSVSVPPAKRRKSTDLNLCNGT